MKLNWEIVQLGLLIFIGCTEFKWMDSGMYTHFKVHFWQYDSGLTDSFLEFITLALYFYLLFDSFWKRNFERPDPLPCKVWSLGTYLVLFAIGFVYYIAIPITDLDRFNEFIAGYCGIWFGIFLKQFKLYTSGKSTVIGN